MLGRRAKARLCPIQRRKLWNWIGNRCWSGSCCTAGRMKRPPAKWAEAQAGPGAAGWEESLVGLAAAQAFYHLVLADGALLPGSLSTPEVKLDWAAREEKARALAQEQQRLCGPVLRDGDFYFGRA